MKNCFYYNHFPFLSLDFKIILCYNIKDNLKAKTGTLSDLSSIAGYLTTKSGKKISFCIIINDIKLSDSDKKMLEDFILREAYLRL